MEEVANQGKNSTQLIQHWIDTGKVEVDDNHVPNIVGNADDQNEMSMKLSKWRRSKLVTPLHRWFTRFRSVEGKLPSQINLILLWSKLDFMKSEIFLSVSYISYIYFIISSQFLFGTPSKHFEYHLFTFEKSWYTFKNYWTSPIHFWKVMVHFQKFLNITDSVLNLLGTFSKSLVHFQKKVNNRTFFYLPPC